jgi:hypothetical protein
MMPGFSLEDWIEYYTQAFNVLTTSVTHEGYGLMPLTLKYSEMVNLLSNTEDKRFKQLRDRVLGPDLIKHASRDFWIFKARHQLNIDTLSWDNMTLAQQGEAIAYVQMHNRIETYVQYVREISKPPPETMPASTKIPRAGWRRGRRK